LDYISIAESLGIS